MYVVGRHYLGSPAFNFQWRIEKRNLTDGALTAFANSDIPGAHDEALDVVIDSSSMYVVGYDNAGGTGIARWRIEKRSLSTLALDAGFGTAGVVISDPAGTDWAYGVAIDSLSMYIVGYETPASPSTDAKWRIEKRAK
jgi:hypothetical protein